MVATETVGPFDGTPWAQDQWYRYAPSWAPSGVIGTPQSAASAGALGLSFSGLTPTLAAGRAWARGAGYELAGGSKTLAALAANTNASLSRRDRIVLRRDLAAKTVSLVSLQGTPASSPAAPALTQVETGQWDSPLFSFTVPPNSGTVITGVTDERTWLNPETGSDTGLIPFTPNIPAGGTGCFYRKVNGVVSVHLDSNASGTYTQLQVFFTLPPGFRPAWPVYVEAMWYGGLTSACSIQTNGDIRLDGGNQAQSGVLFDATFLAA